MIDEDAAIKAIELACERGVDYVEARIQVDEEESIYMRNGIIEAYAVATVGGLSIRVLKNGAFGFASTDDMSAESIKKAVDAAVKLAEVQEKGTSSLSEEPNFSVRYDLIPCKNAFEIPLEEKIKLLADIDKSLQALQDDVKIPFRNIELLIRHTNKFYANSEGTNVRSFIPRLYVSAYFVLAFKDRTITRHTALGEAVGWEKVSIWDPIKVFTDDAAALKKVITNAVLPKAGKYDVIIGPEVSGLATHESCGHPFELDRIMGREGAQAGESYASVDLLGKRIAKNCVTIIDDPTIPGSYGFYLYDEEGVRARPRYLIHKGVVNEFLMNREYAAKLGLKSNGAARASYYNREPIIRMANTYISPGECTFDELIEDVKRGIYIKTFGEWNIDDRRYNQIYVGQEAYIIENGEIKEPVWRPVLEITTPRYYASIDAVDKNLAFQPATCGKGDPSQGVPVFTGGPNVRLRNVRISFRG
ncbi:MAG: TldD/PmbA family protein [Candidatus Korarchaeota archaeon]|nr:TldD/PmbA family protein [Thermoproteota archaeon]MCR8463498.1 TldD/PmbA family protein [Thermoproteota archaeon]MCR8470907.1 TldD/PmbA family protein [Thermoproteota archaeon]MCR8472288.1 TldD/PmbA family protein [Thermoproteota archaeon]MCR8473199.1 TldD/PmbA family protein [Thermoproteota archaeon]